MTPGHPANGRQLADWTDLGKSDVEDAIGELRMAALIRAYQPTDEATNILDRKFGVLPLTRDFLVSRLEDDKDKIRLRASQRIIRSLVETEPNLDWPAIETIDKVDASKNLIIWAMEEAASRGDDALVLEGIRISGYSLGIRGHHAQRLALAHLAFEAAQRLGDMIAAGRCLIFHIAWVHFGWYEFEQCEAKVRDGLILSLKTGDRFSEASAIRLLGLVAKERAEYAKRESRNSDANILHADAQKYLEKSLLIFKEIGDLYFQSITYGAIGSHLRDLGEIEEAESAMLKALNIARSLKSAEEIQSIQCQKLSRLLSGYTERLDEAEAYNREALGLLERLRRPHGVAHCKLNFARIAEKKGQMDIALAYASEAEKLFTAVGAKQDIIFELQRLKALKNGSDISNRSTIDI